MSDTDFLPMPEAKLASFVANFARQINAADSPFPFTEQQAADYQIAADTFIAALSRARAGGTRTPASIQAKNDAKQIIRRMTREYARMVHASPTVTDECKSHLGLTINRPGGRSPRIPRPNSAPRLIVEGLHAGVLRVRLRDRSSERRGRPRGVLGSSLFSFIGDLPPADRDDWTVVAPTGRTRFRLLMPDMPAGASLWLCAQWRNPRGEAGPLCQAVRAWPIAGLHMNRKNNKFHRIPLPAWAKEQNEAAAAKKSAATPVPVHPSQQRRNRNQPTASQEVEAKPTHQTAKPQALPESRRTG